jgi:hypothetical protein
MNGYSVNGMGFKPAVRWNERLHLHACLYKLHTGPSQPGDLVIIIAARENRTNN